MNDLDDLKDALHAPPGFTPKVLDLDAVMVAGGRIRRRRRLATAAGTALAAAGLLAGVAQFVPGPAAPPAGPPVAVTPSYRSGMLGDPVPTGLRAGAAEYVLYVKAIDETSQPETTFGLMLALRHPDGRTTDLVVANEAGGSGGTPGFHAVQGPTNDGQPTFGYYAGPATRITAKAGSRTVTAKQVVWSEDTRIVVFWFPPEGRPLTRLTAYDSAGDKLPAGSNEVAVG